MTNLPATGTALPAWALHTPIDAAWVRRYAAASGDDNPLHVDPAIARAAGFSGPIVPGMMLLGLCERAIRAWYPDAEIQRLAGRFLQPVVTPAALTLTGRVALVNAMEGTFILRIVVGAPNAPPACMADATLRPPQTQA